MSYTHSTYCASCSVADNFNLDEYVKNLSEFVVNNYNTLSNDLQDYFFEMEADEVIVYLNNYVRISGGKLLIEFDSEESNGDVTVWDWLCDNIREDVMTSSIMLFNYATNDSRSGMECGNSYLKKDGTFIDSDEIASIVEQYLKISG